MNKHLERSESAEKSVFHKKGKNHGKESGQGKNLKNFDQEILGGSLEIAKKNHRESSNRPNFCVEGRGGAGKKF